jgi:hypothetical protein
LRDRKSTSRGPATPATFRLQGLVTLWAAYSFRALASFISRRQHSWDSPCGAFSSRKVSTAFPRGCAHVPFLPSVIPPPKRWAGPTGRGFWVLTLPGVPGDRTGVNSPTAGCSLGLYPPRVSRREPGPSICPGSSRTLLRFWSREPQPPASRSFDRLSLDSVHPLGKPGGRTEQPFQGFRTGTSPFTRASHCLGYVFTLHRVVHCCRPPILLKLSGAIRELSGRRLR